MIESDRHHLRVRLHEVEGVLREQMKLKKVYRDLRVIADAKARITTIKGWLDPAPVVPETISYDELMAERKQAYRKLFLEFVQQQKRQKDVTKAFQLTTTGEVDMLFDLLRQPENQVDMIWPKELVDYYKTKVRHEIERQKLTTADATRVMQRYAGTAPAEPTPDVYPSIDDRLPDDQQRSGPPTGRLRDMDQD